MIRFEPIKNFYESHLPEAAWKGHHLVAPCPFCRDRQKGKPGRLAVLLNRDSYFRGYFRCTNECTPGGFHIRFGRLLGIEPVNIPGLDSDIEPYAFGGNYPARHLGPELDKFNALMGPEQHTYFAQFGISQATLNQMKIGFNGRYIVFPYFQENGYAYSSRCVMPNREENSFYHGNEAFFSGEAGIYNMREIDRCEGGSLFIAEGELNALILKELGYPAIAVASAANLADITPDRLSRIEHLFLLVSKSPEAYAAAREFAVQVGFKARILKLPSTLKRGDQLADVAADPDTDTKKTLLQMLHQSKAFSPFASAQSECRHFAAYLEKEKARNLSGLGTGFAKMDSHMEGLRGINVMGGPPKAGKSCFFMQISSEVARRDVPVIYYDFENGRQKIYLRTLVRLTGIAEKKIRNSQMGKDVTTHLKKGLAQLESLFTYFRVINDRQLTPEVMRRHIDFIRHETRKDDLLIVIDSLHKLPFKDLTERRTGIDSWLRELESIRDEFHACFLVISELSRGKGGGYGEKPDLSSFKESGDIEYSADNALILMPDWDPMSPTTIQERKSVLWMVASRESSPGKVADYKLDYPYWRFKEI